MQTADTACSSPRSSRCTAQGFPAARTTVPSPRSSLATGPLVPVGRFGYSDVRNRVWTVTYPLPSKVLKDFLQSLRPGEVVAGTVSGIENFGVFVNLDGAPETSVGFIPPPELSWRWISSGHEVVSLGQRVSAEVLALDTELRGQHRQWPGHEARAVRCLRGS
ncbi:S1 RNA-binding domain-containing protein [Streptomyces hundungensis]|uniref:S1 RNA-binding domain-containing protein n=1 Tax=Streptomyces hundungensis TaxID=1077946 RepID=UPI0033E2AA7F